MLSKLKKKLKPRVPGSKRKQGRTGADAGGERADATGSLPRPGPHVVAGSSHDQEGSGFDAVREQVFSTNRPPQLDEPEPVPGGESENDQKGGEADIDGTKSNQRYLVESGPSREGGGVAGENAEYIHPSLSPPSLVGGGKPDGM
jgi:hypothetical protein